MEFPKFPWKNKEENKEVNKEELAITGLDEQIYQHIGLLSQGRQNTNSTSAEDERWCCDSFFLSDHAVKPYDVQPEPFERSDLEALFDDGFKGIKGYWSIYWESEAQPLFYDELKDDGFRVVVKYRTIQFMIRPPRERDPTKPWDFTNNVSRLRIGAGDMKDCISKVLNRYSNEKMSAVIGTGRAFHPDDDIHSCSPRIPFEWKIDRLSPEYLDQRAYKWRVTTCGGLESYKKLKAQYVSFRSRSGQMDKLPPPGQKPGAKLLIYGKRKYERPTESPESAGLGSHKRQNKSQKSGMRQSSISRPPAPRENQRPPPVTSSSHASTLLSPGDVASSATGGSDPSITSQQYPTQKSSTILPGIGSGSADPMICHVTRELSSVALTLPAPLGSTPNPVYSEPGQDYGYSDQSNQQPGQGQARPPKRYGDDMIKPALDHSRYWGIAPGSLHTTWNAAGPHQGAAQAGGLYQPPYLPSAQGAHQQPKKTNVNSKQRSGTSSKQINGESKQRNRKPKKSDANNKQPSGDSSKQISGGSNNSNGKPKQSDGVAVRFVRA